jgi:hypothetical protein
MPYQFQFLINHHVHFSGYLHRRQCIGHNKNGQRCRRMVCIGLPYCFQHSLTHFHLKVRPSTIPQGGKGIFAVDPTKRANAVIFLPNATICEYTGQVMNLADLHRRYDEYDANGHRTGVHTAPYAIEVNRNTGIDSALVRGIGALANHKSTDDGANCRFVSTHTGRGENRRNIVVLKATRPIRNNQELFVDYGEDYQFDPAEINRTVYRRN